ncbi:hypothetical protein CYMTET_23560 [Cymbomonas tetramitiformis]|uniref:Uncharacterized protein n=1 Tax=Cymbomonas tetramitiformis TaxID=36881 RepID=A0AAE0FXX0_9CHLO|nr:hypothetical protein CYMTET_23560 [Cymbomonas tetramitiformis]
MSAFGFPTDFEVYSSAASGERERDKILQLFPPPSPPPVHHQADFQPPQVLLFHVDVEAVDVSEMDGHAPFSMLAVDFLSGVQRCEVIFASPSGVELKVDREATNGVPEKDFKFNAALTVPELAEPGRYEVKQAECVDGSGNYVIITPQDMRVLGFTAFSVRVHNKQTPALVAATGMPRAQPLGGPAGARWEWNFLTDANGTKCKVLGDVNGDGRFSPLDWEYLQMHNARRPDYPLADRSLCERLQMDPDLDGVIGLKDVVYLRSVLAERYAFLTQLSATLAGGCDGQLRVEAVVLSRNGTALEKGLAGVKLELSTALNSNMSVTLGTKLQPGGAPRPSRVVVEMEAEQRGLYAARAESAVNGSFVSDTIGMAVIVELEREKPDAERRAYPFHGASFPPYSTKFGFDFKPITTFLMDCEAAIRLASDTAKEVTSRATSDRRKKEVRKGSKGANRKENADTREQAAVLSIDPMQLIEALQVEQAGRSFADASKEMAVDSMDSPVWSKGVGE